MTIGPLVPGSPTTVTPDLGHAGYTSAQGVAPDGQVEADDLLSILQVALNVQAKADRRLIYTNITDLATITDVAAGWIADVTGYGRYVATTSSLEYGSPWVIVSTGTAGIYWVNLLATQVRQTATGVSSESRGICRVGPMSIFDAGTPVGRIPKSVVQNHIHHQSALARATLLSGALDASQVLTPELTLLGSTFAAEVGDRVVGEFGPIAMRNWGTSYAEIAITLIQDVDGVGSGPTALVLNRCRIPPANALHSASTPFVRLTPTLPFNRTVEVEGNAEIHFAAAAGNSTFDFEGVNATEFYLGSLTVYRP